MTARKSTTEAIAYCATCRTEFGSCDDANTGSWFKCPNADPEGRRHVARVVRGRVGKAWLRVESFVLDFEHRYSPRRWFNCWGGFFKKRAGLYVSMQILAGLAVAFVAATRVGLPRVDFWLRVSVLVVSWALILDCVIGNTSVAFVSRHPTNYFRTLIFAMGSFLAIVFAFGANYAACRDCYTLGSDPGASLNAIQAIYFSFVTVTTLGYGDIRPVVHAAGPQILVVSQLVIGLYYVAGVIAVLSSWSDGGPHRSPAMHLGELLLGVEAGTESKVDRRGDV